MGASDEAVWQDILAGADAGPALGYAPPRAAAAVPAVPRRPGFTDPGAMLGEILGLGADAIGGGVRAVVGHGLGPENQPEPPPAPPMMMPTPRPAPPSSRGVPLRPTGEAVKERDERSRAAASSSTQGGTATGPLNPSVAGQPPRIPAWMAAGSQPRFTPTAEQRSSQDAVFNDLAGSLRPGETLSRNLPGSMANVYSDIGFDQAMDARDQATLARTKTAIDQEHAAQVLDDLTGGTQKRIRGLALDNALVDMLPAGSRGRIGANYGAGWGPGLSGSEVGSEAVGEKELGGMTMGEEKAIDRVIAGQQGKMASAQNEHAARQAQTRIIGDLRLKRGMLQAKLADGKIDGATAEREFRNELQLADRELQALGGGKDFLSQYKNDMGGDSVFATDKKGG